MSKYFPTHEECGHHAIFPGVNIQTFSLPKMMVSIVDLAPHSVVAEHSHPHEQMGMWLAGKAVFTIGDEQRTVQAGDIYRIPGNIKHKVEVLEQAAKAIDIFSPPREEYA